MKKMMKNVMVGTMAGIMAAAMPFAVSASEIDAEQEMAYEMDAEAAQQVVELNLSDPKEMLTALEGMSDEECMEVLADVGVLFVADADFRSIITLSCLEASGVELTEEEKAIVADIMKNITVDDVVEAVQEVDFNEVFQEVGEAVNKYLEECKVEEAKEIDAQLDALGHMLIDVNMDDILAFLS